ncbi:MAG: hypothetical protein PHQ43_05830 [Dehalococcoidales bacterium]|nr:hypothetical protein [Dehalococcoidales bacterium]
MAVSAKHLSSSQMIIGGNGGSDAEVIRSFVQAIRDGEHWFLALLRAIGLWNTAEEVHDGRRYCYLVAGEAFDWLLLAERLCSVVDHLLPDAEKTALLFHGQPPLGLTIKEFKSLIGSSKYRHYLNFFYGVTVEDALFLVVQDEVRKEQRASGYSKEEDVVNEVYRRVYGATKGVLLKRFRTEKGYPHLRSIGLGELKEFTYWLFKYRLRQCDRVRIASDTRKALNRLAANGFPPGLRRNIINNQNYSS